MKENEERDMLTSKQRAYLRSLAVDLDTILIVGKSGMSPDIIKPEATVSVRRMSCSA